MENCRCKFTEHTIHADHANYFEKSDIIHVYRNRYVSLQETPHGTTEPLLTHYILMHMVHVLHLQQTIMKENTSSW